MELFAGVIMAFYCWSICSTFCGTICRSSIGRTRLKKPQFGMCCVYMWTWVCLLFLLLGKFGLVKVENSKGEIFSLSNVLEALLAWLDSFHVVYRREKSKSFLFWNEKNSNQENKIWDLYNNFTCIYLPKLLAVRVYLFIHSNSEVITRFFEIWFP